MDKKTTLIDRPLAELVTEAINADKVQLPPLPELALRLQEMLSRAEDIDTREVAGLVHSDPALAASILRIANSAAFGGLRQVTDLNQAIARLGLKQVGSMLTAVLLRQHFSDGGAGAKRGILNVLWDHSIAVAFCAKRLAARGDVDPESAFLAGLLHDTGRLLVLAAADHLEREGSVPALTRPLLIELMEPLHCKLGHQTLNAWNLPEPICRVALQHEEAAVPGDELLLCVQVADLMAQKLGFHLDPLPELVLMNEPAVEILGLKDLELATLMVDLEDELQEIRRLF
jgi:HD-like signal output (HDOD) protein